MPSSPTRATFKGVGVAAVDGRAGKQGSGASGGGGAGHGRGPVPRRWAQAVRTPARRRATTSGSPGAGGRPRDGRARRPHPPREGRRAAGHRPTLGRRIADANPDPAGARCRSRNASRAGGRRRPGGHSQGWEAALARIDRRGLARARLPPTFDNEGGAGPAAPKPPPAVVVALVLERGAPIWMARDVLDFAGVTPEDGRALTDS